MRKVVPVILIGILAFTVFWNRTRIPYGQIQRVLDLETVRNVHPRASGIEYHLTPFSYYSVYKSDMDTGEKILTGYAFLTTDIVPHITGYIGPIITLVGVDLAGQIRGIRILEHHETPSYVYGIDQDWWLKQFIDLGPQSNISPDADIDAISSATVTVRAICQSVQESLQQIAEKLLAKSPLSVKGTSLNEIFNRVEIYFFALIFFLSSLSYIRAWRRLRTLLLIVSFLYLGVKLKLLFSVVHVSSLLGGTLPHFSIAAFLWVFLALIFVTSFFLGRVYCGFICPFGTIQEFLYKISPWRIKVKPSWDMVMKKIKYLLLWVILVAALLYPAFRVTNYEPFALAFTLRGPFLVWCFTLLVLLFSLFIERFYCRYFCLAGAALALLSKLAFIRLKVKGDCGTCSFCEEVCQTEAIHGLEIDAGECILCNRCRMGCPQCHIKL